MCISISHSLCLVPVLPVVCWRAHVLFTLMVCACVCIVVSNIHCVAFLLCFISSSVPYVVSFSRLSFWIALWYFLTFNYRRLTFFPKLIWIPTFSAEHNNLASVVWHTSLMLFHFNTVTTNSNGEGNFILIDAWGSLFVPLSLYCPSSGQCIICPSSIYGLQLPVDIFLLLHMYDLLYW